MLALWLWLGSCSLQCYQHYLIKLPHLVIYHRIREVSKLQYLVRLKTSLLDALDLRHQKRFSSMSAVRSQLSVKSAFDSFHPCVSRPLIWAFDTPTCWLEDRLNRWDLD